MTDHERRIKAYQSISARKERLSQELEGTEAELRRTVEMHMERSPLAGDRLHSLEQALLAGRTLCCDRGLGNLRELFPDDPIWQEVLGDWAYEHLGCQDEWLDYKSPRLAILKIWAWFTDIDIKPCDVYAHGQKPCMRCDAGESGTYGYGCNHNKCPECDFEATFCSRCAGYRGVAAAVVDHYLDAHR